MNLSIQSHIMNKNTNYTLLQKKSHKGMYLTREAFAAEDEIIKMINALPKYIFLECAEFVKLCKKIDITPKITGALKKRLIEARQTNGKSKSFIV